MTTMQERIVEEYNLNVQTDGLVIEPCSRCDGTGHYSFNLLDGTRCFKCRGQKTQRTKLTTLVRRIRNRELDAKRRQAELDAEESIVIDVSSADLYAAAQTHKDALRAAEVAKMSHFGVVGGKIDVELKFCHCANFDTQFGTCYLFIFEDVATGSSAVWFTSSPPYNPNNSDDKGKTFRVRATVKEHGEYEGKPQTKLIRCKFEE